ncbi:26S proteasome non-ATPase regulatory subunit 10-like [Ptychodera flava]|uniref:26S proteasome non-ATPase regulatory subunit 10-like n=1 Tax=Ptychodera flava TaxID=63121 RepID=UPI00396A8AFA
MAASDRKNPQDLIDAAERGDVERAKSLIDDGCDVNGRGNFWSWSNSTALHVASREGHADVAEVLIKHGADVNAKNNIKRTPLHYAADNGHEATTRLLLQSKAAIVAQDFNGNTPFHYAAECGGEKTTKLLLQYKASVDIQNKDGKRPVEVSVGTNKDVLLDYERKHKEYNDLMKESGFEREIMKVFLCGEGGVGKTTLKESLQRINRNKDVNMPACPCNAGNARRLYAWLTLPANFKNHVSIFSILLQ